MLSIEILTKDKNIKRGQFQLLIFPNFLWFTFDDSGRMFIGSAEYNQSKQNVCSDLKRMKEIKSNFASAKVGASQ